MAALGFDFIRLPVDPAILQDGSGMRADRMAILDAAIDRLQSAGLAVIVDMHPVVPWVEKLAASKSLVTQYALFLNAVARHLASRDAKLTLFELLNEPVGFQTAAWNEALHKFWAAARDGAPALTLVLQGANWSTVGGLTEVTKVPDPNVIYTFHFYEPVFFTHQGATWGLDLWKMLEGVPYPGTPENVQLAIERSLANAAGDESKRAVELELRKYGNERVSRMSLETTIARAAAWARRNGVHIFCGEFGVYKKNAPRADRYHWLRDARELFEANVIPWAYWEYHASFGLVDRRRNPDAAACASLGLRAPDDAATRSN